MKKKAAIITYIISIICLLGLLVLLVYSTLYGGASSATANFTVSDAALLGLAAWAIPMWGAAIFLMRSIRLRGTLHEKQNRMLISFPAFLCSGFFVFYGIVLVNMALK